MKRIIIALFAALLSLTASAQYVDKELVVRNGCIYADGTRLSDVEAASYFKDIYGFDRSADYLRYSRKYRCGLGMTIGGGAAFLAGGSVSAVGFAKILMKGIGKEEFKRAQAMTIASSFVTLGGAVVMAAGIPTMISGNEKLRNLTAASNSSRKFSLGPASEGVGLALKF